MATLNATLLEQPPDITLASLSTALADAIIIRQGDSVRIEHFVYIPGYDFQGDGSTTGLDASLCVAQVKAMSGTTESDSLLDFDVQLTPITFEAGTKNQGWLRIVLSATPAQTLAIDVAANENLDTYYDVQIGFFETLAGAQLIKTVFRGNVSLVRKGSEVIT